MQNNPSGRGQPLLNYTDVNDILGQQSNNLPTGSNLKPKDVRQEPSLIPPESVKPPRMMSPKVNYPEEQLIGGREQAVLRNVDPATGICYEDGTYALKFEEAPFDEAMDAASIESQRLEQVEDGEMQVFEEEIDDEDDLQLYGRGGYSSKGIRPLLFMKSGKARNWAESKVEISQRTPRRDDIDITQLLSSTAKLENGPVRDAIEDICCVLAQVYRNDLRCREAKKVAIQNVRNVQLFDKTYIRMHLENLDLSRERFITMPPNNKSIEITAFAPICMREIGSAPADKEVRQFLKVFWQQIFNNDKFLPLAFTARPTSTLGLFKIGKDALGSIGGMLLELFGCETTSKQYFETKYKLDTLILSATNAYLEGLRSRFHNNRKPYDDPSSFPQDVKRGDPNSILNYAKNF